MNKTIIRQRAPRIVGQYKYDGKDIFVYKSENGLFFSLNQIAVCNKLVLGGESLVRYMHREKCLRVARTSEVFAPVDDVRTYLKRSRKKVANNLYGFITFILDKEAQKAAPQPAKPTSQQKSKVQPAAPQAASDAHKGLVLVHFPHGDVWCTPAEAKFYNAQKDTQPAKKEEEVPGIYFDLRPFFDTTPMPLKWYKGNLRAFTDEIKDAVRIMLKVGEPLRGEDRQDFISVLECLGNYQTLLNSI